MTSRARVLAVALSLVFTGLTPAKADLCSDPAEVEARYQHVTAFLQSGAEPDNLQTFVAETRAIAVLTWSHKGRDAVARDGFVVNAIAACLARGACGLTRDDALSQRLYDDINHGYRDRVFASTMYERPPTTAMAFARATFGCPLQPAAGRPGEGDRPALGASDHHMLTMLSAYQNRQFDEAYRLAVPLCSANQHGACHIAGMVKKGSGDAGDLALARSHFSQGCALGMAMSCTEYGALLQQGDGGPADAVGARTAYRQACDGGQAAGCGLLGEAIFDGIGGAADDAEGARLLEAACDQDFAPACVRLILIASSRDRRADSQRFANRACALGSGSGCALAEVLRGFIALEDNQPMGAYAHFVAACGRDDGGAYAAGACEEAVRTVRDYQLAVPEAATKDHFERGCALGNQTLCSALQASQ